ncbi:MAG: hypothetical protein WA419_10910, partial [Silvibacterium sp.]
TIALFSFVISVRINSPFQIIKLYSYDNPQSNPIPAAAYAARERVAATNEAAGGDPGSGGPVWI